MTTFLLLALFALGPFAGIWGAYVMDSQELKNPDWVQLYGQYFWPWNWAFSALIGVAAGLVGLADRIEARKAGKS